MSDALFDAKLAEIESRKRDDDARRVFDQSQRMERFQVLYTIPKTKAEEAFPRIVDSSSKLQVFIESLWRKQHGRDAILLVVDYWKRDKPLGLILFKDGMTLEVWVLDNSGNLLHQCSQDELMSAVEFNHLPFANTFEQLAQETAFDVFLGRLPFRNM